MTAIVPKLGIFWIIDGEVISFSVPLDRAEHIGGFANYRHGHNHLWPYVQRLKPHVRASAYDFLPRGRVTYIVRCATFNLLVPLSCSTETKLVSLLVSRFALPISRVRVMTDEHYEPRDCCD